MDADGAKLASRRLPEGLARIRRFHELASGHQRRRTRSGGDRHETDRGLWVDALSAAGYEVFAVHALAVARYRDRHHVSGGNLRTYVRSPGDAKLLADLVRTDRRNHRPLAGDTPAVEAIEVLA